MIRVAFLRHGRTGWNREGRIQGRTDRPLDDEGRAELTQFAPPPEWRDVELVSSPLSRASETGAILFGRAPRRDPALIEMDWGAWEGQRGEALLAQGAPGFRPIEEWGWAFQPPGGEALWMLRERVAAWMAALERDTVAVAHIGVMRVALAIATGWNFEGPAPFRIRRSRLYPIRLQPELSAEEPLRLIKRSEGMS
ncbi:MAG: histidine phosphatase family protein [Neomegalonema sp.]|nr:histidine phosphatase family protein [Neomegalonema sp.]